MAWLGKSVSDPSDIACQTFTCTIHFFFFLVIQISILFLMHYFHNLNIRQLFLQLRFSKLSAWNGHRVAGRGLGVLPGKEGDPAELCVVGVLMLVWCKICPNSLKYTHKVAPLIADVLYINKADSWIFLKFGYFQHVSHTYKIYSYFSNLRFLY